MHPDSLLCVVEIPRGGRNKYEYDPEIAQLRKEIRHFFEIYKDLDPDRCSDVMGWDDRWAALDAIERAGQAFRDSGG